MARIYYRSSLFLYSYLDEKKYIIEGWRATVYTFWRPASRQSLRGILEDTAGPLIEPKESWEEEQVEPGECKGLGFYWVDVSRFESRGVRVVVPETRVEVVHLPTWEKTHVRRGYGLLQEWSGIARAVQRGFDAMASLFGGAPT